MAARPRHGRTGADPVPAGRRAAPPLAGGVRACASRATSAHPSLEPEASESVISVRPTDVGAPVAAAVAAAAHDDGPGGPFGGVPAGKAPGAGREEPPEELASHARVTTGPGECKDRPSTLISRNPRDARGQPGLRG